MSIWRGAASATPSGVAVCAATVSVESATTPTSAEPGVGTSQVVVRLLAPPSCSNATSPRFGDVVHCRPVSGPVSARTGEPRPSTIAYQPALDGVRALAVMAVLLFHGEVAGFGGGYLGVSVFFTLSGFLITSLLAAETEAKGSVGLGAFYSRRARRLLPASVLLVVLVMIASVVTDWFDAVADLRVQIIGSLLQVANWVFLASDGSYQELLQQAAGAASPLEHYWSLAIEEQFYWLWPLAFVGLWKLGRTPRGRLVLLGAVTAVFVVVAPVTAAVWGGDAAYWASPARAAEILFGAFLALALAGRTVLAAAAGCSRPLRSPCSPMCIVTFPPPGARRIPAGSRRSVRSAHCCCSGSRSIRRCAPRVRLRRWSGSERSATASTCSTGRSSSC